MIHTQLETIVKQLANEKEDEQYRECEVWLINAEAGISFIVDLKHFKFEANDKWLYLEYDGGNEEAGVIIYSHAIKVSQISYITSEV